jgi:hypothetical protein
MYSASSSLGGSSLPLMLPEHSFRASDKQNFNLNTQPVNFPGYSLHCSLWHTPLHLLKSCVHGRSSMSEVIFNRVFTWLWGLQTMDWMLDQLLRARNSRIGGSLSSSNWNSLPIPLSISPIILKLWSTLGDGGLAIQRSMSPLRWFPACITSLPTRFLRDRTRTAASRIIIALTIERLHIQVSTMTVCENPRRLRMCCKQASRQIADFWITSGGAWAELELTSEFRSFSCLKFKRSALLSSDESIELILGRIRIARLLVFDKALRIEAMPENLSRLNSVHQERNIKTTRSEHLRQYPCQIRSIYHRTAGQIPLSKKSCMLVLSWRIV